MTEPAAVLRYLADISASTTPARNHVATARRADVTMVPWSPILSPGRDALAIAATPEVSALRTLDVLHPAESLLRVGWLWLAGTLAQGDSRVRFVTPLLSAVVTMDPAGPGSFTMRRLDDASIAAGLIEDPGLVEALEDRAEELIVRSEPSPDAAAAWALDLARAAGFAYPVLADAADHPWEHRDAEHGVVVPAMALFVGRDVDAPDVSGALMTWASADVADTAFDRLYRPGVPPVATGTAPVESAFPLNEGQRDALDRARTEPITVVSGPPGTGKSHVAAALAVDVVASGRSVLVATQTDYAADVIAALLERYPGPRAVRFGRRDRRASIAEELAGGMAVPYPGGDLERLEGRLADAAARRDAIRRVIEHGLEAEQAFARGLRDRATFAPAARRAPAVVERGFDLDAAERLAVRASRRDGVVARWLAARAERRLRRLAGAAPEATMADLDGAVRLARAEHDVRRGLEDGGLALGDRWEELERADAAWREAAGRVIEARRRSRENRRKVSTRSVAALAAALRAGRVQRRRMLRRLKSEHFLDVLPMWLGTLTEIDDTLPVEAGVFDVVIFDEASQIDQARSAPALARARSAVIIGDNRQLRHVSFVGDDVMIRAAEGAGIEGALRTTLDVRRNSLFDAGVAVAPVTALVEHFRSVPHIIGFSDRSFYQGRLRLMTQHPGTESADAIRVVTTSGKRGDDGVNHAEVDAVHREVAVAIERGVESIGVVSPFRAQADALEEMLLARFRSDVLERHGVRAGTVHAFQGNERDLMIASIGYAAGDAAGSLRFLQDPHLFNVLVTRARHEMVVVTSVEPSDLHDGLLRSYLRYAEEPPLPSRTALVPGGWIGELAGRLAGYGLPTVAGYPVAGWSVDLAVGEGAAAIGIECEVHPDGAAAHVERHQALARAGWRMSDAFQSRWLALPDDAVEGIVTAVLDRSAPG